MAKEEQRILTLDKYEHGVVINALNEMRNDLIGEERPTDIVDEVLLKAIDAPSSSRTLHRLFPPKGEKCTRSVVPPLPTKSDDFAGIPERKERRRFREER